MAPTTRSNKNKAAVTTAIVVHDSDSEPETLDASLVKRSPKRQKIGPGLPNTMHDISMNADPPAVKAKGKDNSHLKGRKRFVADLKDMKDECGPDGRGFAVGGLKVKLIRAGDEEGSIELVIVKAHGDHLLSVNLLISEASDYPKSHSFFAYTPDGNVPAPVQEIVEDIASQPSRLIRETVQKFMEKIDRATNPQTRSAKPLQSQPSQEMDEDEDEDEDDNYAAFDALDDDDFTAGGSKTIKGLVMEKLQRDFVETIATGYRPGLVPYSTTPGPYSMGDFCITISLPLLTLAERIPPQALMAWDRRLLSSKRARHLVLLITGLKACYPVLDARGELSEDARKVGVRLGTGSGADTSAGGELRFKVGMASRYKPAREVCVEVGRNYGLKGSAEDDYSDEDGNGAALPSWDPEDDLAVPPVEEPTYAYAYAETQEVEGQVDEGAFEKFSLSSSLESLMDAAFVKLVQLRRRFGIGWAGAEVLFTEMEKGQRRPEDVVAETAWMAEIHAADKQEAKLSRTRGNMLPHDPLTGLGKHEEINFPLTAFCYLVRRLSLCTRYCIVCHNKINTDFEALKPFVCDSKLCAYQYYSLNRGPSLEYEITHNPATVDLLLSLTYSAAAEQVLDEPLPIGMGLRVPLPDASRVQPPPQTPIFGVMLPGIPAPQQPQPATENKPLPVADNKGLVDFDDLDVPLMRASIVQMIDSLPSVDEMKKHLQRKVKPGKSKPRLKDMEGGMIHTAAWSVLRWCVASCTAYLEEIMSGDECIQNLDPAWRQFRFSVGAPDAEAKFKAAVEDVQKTDKNAKKFPSLYAFHGSALRNWHSIIRHGLWFKTVANGRAFGHGVYLAKDGSVSMGHYAAGGRASWRKSRITPTNCVALAEIVNLPSQFVSSNPYFVVKDTHWIMCRYLLVKGLDAPVSSASTTVSNDEQTPFVKLDPAHPTTMSNKPIVIPEPTHRITMLLSAKEREHEEEEHDEVDAVVFTYSAPAKEVIEVSDDDDMNSYDDDDDSVMVIDDPAPSTKGKGKASSFVSAVSSAFKGGSKSASSASARRKDDWKHDPAYVTSAIEHLMPPPFESTPSATMAVQRELKTMLKEQEKAEASSGGLKELGWYMPPDLIGDNLFQWIVEMHSFDESLPIAKDLKNKKVNSIIFEIRFPPSFPLSPPFFRIVTPRFLPFIQGGGGHVTGGGSICMDLLTSDGWLPSYSISAVLMQIKLAISNLDPRPARLAQDWNRHYHVSEALQGFKRAAATHGWQVPPGLDKLVR